MSLVWAALVHVRTETLMKAPFKLVFSVISTLNQATSLAALSKCTRTQLKAKDY